MCVCRCVCMCVCVCVCVSLFEILSKVTDFMKIIYKKKIINVRVLNKPQ